MKAKLFAKRVRERSDAFRGLVDLGQEGYTVSERARLIAEVLLEVADQIDLPSKKKKKKEKNRLKKMATKAAKRAAKMAKKAAKMAKKAAKQG